jgi:hypothetical protein
MDYIEPFLLIAAGILAASSLIVAKKPNAKELIAKLSPYQAFIGIVLLVWGIYNLIRIGPGFMFDLIKLVPLFGISILAMLICSVLLGIMFGIPMIAKASASGAAKAEEIAKKLAPFQILLGIVAIASSLVYLLYIWGILGHMRG